MSDLELRRLERLARAGDLDARDKLVIVRDRLRVKSALLMDAEYACWGKGEMHAYRDLTLVSAQFSMTTPKNVRISIRRSFKEYVCVYLRPDRLILTLSRAEIVERRFPVFKTGDTCNINIDVDSGDRFDVYAELKFTFPDKR